MPARKFSDEVIEQAIALREEGIPHTTIGKQLGMSRSTVFYHCLKLGAEPPDAAINQRPPRKPITMKRGNHIVRQFTPEEDQRLLAMDLSGETLGAIAKTLGRKRNSVQSRLQTIARNQDRAEQRTSQ